MPSVLVVGATRGLGAELVKQYASRGSGPVYATSRSDSKPEGFPGSVKWLTNIDLTDSEVAEGLTKQLEGEKPLDIVVCMITVPGNEPPKLMRPDYYRRSFYYGRFL
jgi:NAD(P)-dependent dehydrogenase (short-subunit alcohol dehydrogenase family)